MLKFVILIIFFIDVAFSFGYVGHEIAAVIAQRFLSPKARANVIKLLPPEAKGNLSFIAAWADQIKHSPKYRFTSPLHYVSPPKDFPPETCSFSYTPSEPNVINAINNYTRQLDPKSGLKYYQRAIALRFLVHFIGDLHQPLHITTREKGGTKSPAIFEGHKTNLHYIWDSTIIYKQIRELYSNGTSSSDHSSNASRRDGKSYDLYVEHIIKLIKTIWIKDISDWMVCKDEIKFDAKKYLESQIQFQQPHISNNNNNNDDDDDVNNKNPKIPSHSAVCPDFWAPSLNKLNCQIVYKNYDPEIDLSIGEYYERIVKGKVMEKLLAIAGIRIAAVLNTLLG